VPVGTGPAVFEVFRVQVPTGYALIPINDFAARSKAWVGPDSSIFVLTWSKPVEAIALHFDDHGSVEHEPSCTLELIGAKVTLRLARQTLLSGLAAYSAEGVLELPDGVLHVNLMTRTSDQRKELLWALARATRL
jgi:hypothetical protein